MHRSSTRSNPTGPLLPFDPEIERTRKRLERESRSQQASSSSNPFPSMDNRDPPPDDRLRDDRPHADHPHGNNPPLDDPPRGGYRLVQAPAAVPDARADRPLTLGEASLNVQHLLAQHPLCITYPLDTGTFELRSSFINLLPTFYGKPGEDPISFIKEFQQNCDSLKPSNANRETVMLRAFPFVLKDKAKDWLYFLPPGSIHTWADMVSIFTDHYFSSSRASQIIRQIVGISMDDDEPLYQYWERYQRLLASCPQHNQTDISISRYYYDGLTYEERRNVDNVCGGHIMNRTARQMMELYEIMANQSRHYGAKRGKSSQSSSDGGSSNFAIEKLTNLVERLITHQSPQHVKACGVCSATAHTTDACPTLFENSPQVNALSNQFHGNTRGPYSNTYNQDTRNHPNLSYNPHNRNYQSFVPRGQPLPESSNTSSLEDLMKNLFAQHKQEIDHQKQDTDRQIKHLETQLSQMAQQLARQNELGRLPSQPHPNPNANASAITLRNGRELKEPQPRSQASKANKEEHELEVLLSRSKQTEKPEKEVPQSFTVRPPFPQRLILNKKKEEEKEILETFRKVEINIPLLDALKQVPRYVKFLKELCTNKGKLKGNEKVQMGESDTAILQKKLPPKCKDPGMFSVPCIIGNVSIEKAMCDLGASINVMPLSIYENLKVGSLHETGIIIQLADRSVVRPEGVLEDVLVRVNELVFPADFYVIDMKDESFPHSSSVLLGRPFLKTARAKIDVHDGSLTMEFDGEVIKFNIYDAMRFPSDVSSVVCCLDSVDSLVDAASVTKESDELRVVLEHHLNTTSLDEGIFILDTGVEEICHELDSVQLTSPTACYVELHHINSTILPSLLKAPTLELKPLPEHLKYMFLGENDTLPVIISAKLSSLEEEKLIRVLGNLRKQLGGPSQISRV
ncbi:hypothetical protein Sjap_002584 [Stephania japonica]|uniref:Retrotransposon gag domain-containing protein n=1 Tax=Stephania japonica TaxID=461633 RepID=A0AAP0KNW9_9MAGN